MRKRVIDSLLDRLTLTVRMGPESAVCVLTNNGKLFQLTPKN
jgi:hypothetical protein